MTRIVVLSAALATLCSPHLFAGESAAKHYRTGQSYMKKFDLVKAATEFEKAAVLDPDRAEYRSRFDSIRVEASDRCVSGAQLYLSVKKPYAAQLMLLQALHFNSKNDEAAKLLNSVNEALQAEIAAGKPKDDRLTNADVISMIQAQIDPEIIITKLKSSACNFDTSVAALGELKRVGATKDVLLAVLQAPKAPAPLGPDDLPAGNLHDLRSIRSIFIEPMPNQLDQYIRAEITKRCKGKLSVVLVRESADAILVGVGDQKDGTLPTLTGRYLGLHDLSEGSISLLNPDGTVVLWSSEAGDRSIWWGPLTRSGVRKVAARLVDNLKHAIGI